MLESLISLITRSALRFKWVTIGLSILAMVGGAIAVTQLKQELLPRIEFPQTVVLAFNSGATPEEMRDEVTIPIENAVRDIEGVVNVESTTTGGTAFIIVRNGFGVDLDAIRVEIQASIEGVSYPEGMDTPELLTFSLADLPVASVSVSSSSMSLAELKDFVQSDIIPALEELPDVASVSVSGGQQLPTAPPETPEPTPEPTIEATPEPTAAPTEAPAPAVEGNEVEAVALPASWIQAAAAQSIEIATTADLTPALVGGVASLAPQLLEDLSPEMLLAMSPEILIALPQTYLFTLDAELQTQLLALLSSAEELDPVALPDSWIQAAAGQGIEIATTADLTPELVGGIASLAPQLLEDLSAEMLLAMPLDILAALPQTYLLTLDADIQLQLLERLTSASGPEEGEDAGALPAAWQSIGQAQGFELNRPEDITPEIIQGISSLAPQLLDMLTPEHLLLFSPEVLAWLPAEYIEQLDPDLRTDLDELAQAAGGLGSLAQAAAEAAAALSADAPALSGSWLNPPEDDPDGTSQFQTAADLMTSGFAPTAAGFLNLFVSSGNPNAPDFLGDLTPEIMVWLGQNEEGFLQMLEAQPLRLLPAEVLTSLPEDFLASLDPALRTELEGIAAGTVEVFVPTDTINRVNGDPSLALTIFKDGEANVVAVSHAIFEKFDELEAEDANLHFSVAFEQASFIEESISGVTREGGLGALFAVIVILLFLSGNVDGRYKLSWRSTFVTAVSIPLSLFMALAFMKWLPPIAHVALDPLGDATASVPVLGTVFTILQRMFPLDVTLNIMTLSGMTVAVGRVVDDSIVVLENIYRHIQQGGDRREAVLLGTGDVAMPIFASTVTTIVVFLPIGLLGGLIGEFFLPFGVAVSFALASSFIVAVTIVPLLAYLFIHKEDLPPEGESTLQRRYTPVLERALKNRALTLVIAGALLLGSIALLAQRPRSFLPNLGEVQISASVDLPSGTTMEETDELVAEFESALAQIDGVGTIQAEVGTAGGFQALLLGGSVNQSLALIQVELADSAVGVDELTAAVREAADEVFGKDFVIVSSGTLSSGAFGGFALVLSGEREQLAAVNDDVIAALNGIEGLANASSNLAETDTFLRIDGESAVRFSGDLEVEDTLGVTELAKAQVESLVPAGVTVSEGFETKQQTEGFAQATQAISVSVLAVYVVLVLMFRSLVHPFTILFSLPLAIIGAALALWITNRVVGLSVLIGMMMLVGIVVTNAIVLIARVQDNRFKRGMNIYDALVEGGRTRLRPILMTAIAAILALVPLALGLTEGAIIATELATVVIGGLLTSTLLTLVVVPVMYSLLDRLSRRRPA